MLNVSYSCRCASVAMVSKTMDDLPEPETPVKMVILRFGMRNDTFFRLFSRAPRISMYSWGIIHSLPALSYGRRASGGTYASSIARDEALLFQERFVPRDGHEVGFDFRDRHR